MNIPEGLHYSEEHEWLRVEETDAGLVAIVGITDFAQSELGEIVYVEVDTVGDSLDQNEVFGTVEAVKTTSDLFMPVAGEILEFNPSLNEEEGDNPALVNEDPYGEGWIVKIKIDSIEVVEGLLSHEKYAELTG